MVQDGAGTDIYGLRKRIRAIRSDLDSLGEFEAVPELIDSANLLRSNEYLGKKTSKQADLADAYSEYSRALEGMLSALFEIQDGLRDVLRAQSSLLSKPGSKRRARKDSKR